MKTTTCLEFYNGHTNVTETTVKLTYKINSPLKCPFYSCV